MIGKLLGIIAGGIISGASLITVWFLMNGEYTDKIYVAYGDIVGILVYWFLASALIIIFFAGLVMIKISIQLLRGKWK